MKLYVGNLPYSVTDDELREMFEGHGAVASASVVIDRETGRSRGFGFVEMNDDNEARGAIEALHGQEVGGRNLTVNEARPRAPRSGGSGGYGGGGGRGGRGGYGGGGRQSGGW
ncbi:MAG: RNA-binding protein [Planctomycetota bacterium]|nr:MAG: RNA-binding protein [Planctomycetota bacterium]